MPKGYVNIPRSMIKEQSCKANEPPNLLYIMFQIENKNNNNVSRET